MRRHIDRELARARTRGGDRLRPDIATAIAPLVQSLVSTVARTDTSGRIKYQIAIPDDLIVPFDRADLAEVLGNLLENATRHAKSLVRIQVNSDGTAMTVEDDGPGIALNLRSTAMERGSRLDQRGNGTGIGLAIVQDVLDAYRWTLQLQTSELGGLKASCFARRD